MEQRSSSPDLDVERIARHAERPGFRISELQISPTQEVPWHSHTNISDTFYVLVGRIAVDLSDPQEHIELGPGESWGPVVPLRAHRVSNAGRTSATFLALQGIGQYDFVPAD
jgi:quercetin dioxygenase-like cupin family protein